MRIIKYTPIFYAAYIWFRPNIATLETGQYAVISMVAVTDLCPYSVIDWNSLNVSSVLLIGM